MNRITIIVFGGIGNIKNQELFDIISFGNIFAFRNNVDAKQTQFEKNILAH
ncbi:MAG: hypothetical protein IIC76_07865 [Bacteroidetes bacterium]|nr:hypothetical protein [Bacteroidota bacterium]